MTRLVITGILLLAIAACGKQPDGAGAGGAPAAPPSSTTTTSKTPSPSQNPSVTTPPPGSQQVPADKINADNLGVANYPKTAWTEGDGRTLTVVALGDGCNQFAGIVHDETGSSVAIGFASTMMACQDMKPTPVAVKVNLAAPLGNRTIVYVK